MTHKDLIRKLRKCGFLFERTGAGHYKVRKEPEGRFVLVSFSPSDDRATLNSVMQIRKMLGIDIRKL